MLAGTCQPSLGTNRDRCLAIVTYLHLREPLLALNNAMADNLDQSPSSLWSRSKRHLGVRGLTFLQHVPKDPKGKHSLSFPPVSRNANAFRFYKYLRPDIHASRQYPIAFSDTTAPNIKSCHSKRLGFDCLRHRVRSYGRGTHASETFLSVHHTAPNAALEQDQCCISIGVKKAKYATTR